VALGYVGLILIIFEGSMSMRLDLLRATVWCSCVVAFVGVITPIGLSFLLLNVGFGYSEY